MTRTWTAGWLGLCCAAALCGGCLVPQPAGKGKDLHLTEPQTKTAYYLYLPEDYVKTNGKRSDGGKWPLVMTFHGMKPFDTYDRQIHEWQEESDRYGFITCAPLMSHASALDPYPIDRETKAFANDVKNVLAVIQDVFRRTEADPTRVLSTGWSEGGYMAHYMANRYPSMFTCLAVKQCNFSSEIMDASRAGRYRDMPVAIFYTENDFGICRKESVEAVAWYKRQGFRVTSGVIDSYGHERMPELAADFFAKHCGAVPKTPPKELARIRMSEIPPDALAKADVAKPIPHLPPPPPASVNYADSQVTPRPRTPQRTAAPVFNAPEPTRSPDNKARRLAEVPVSPSASGRAAGAAGLDSSRYADVLATLAGRSSDDARGGREAAGPGAAANAAPDNDASQTLTLPRYELPSYRVPPRPPGTLTPPRTRSRPPRYRPAAAETSAEVRLSTTIGLSPLLVSFEVHLPASQLGGADILWTDNGEPIANGATGQHILTEIGEHRIGVLVITEDGRELRDSQVVTVHPRSQVGASGM